MLQSATRHSLKVTRLASLSVLRVSGTRRFHSQTAQEAHRIKSTWTLAPIAAAVAAGAVWYATVQGDVVHNDAPSESPEGRVKTAGALANALDGDDLFTMVWGSNQ